MAVEEKQPKAEEEKPKNGSGNGKNDEEEEEQNEVHEPFFAPIVTLPEVQVESGEEQEKELHKVSQQFRRFRLHRSCHFITLRAISLRNVNCSRKLICTH